MSKQPTYALPGDILGGYTSIYLLSKHYSNMLVGEVSSQVYGGILRVISLGITEGISTWRTKMLCMLQPVCILTGKVSLGRIYNVLGAVVDQFLGNTLSSGYHIGCMTSFLEPVNEASITILDQIEISSSNKVLR